MQIFDFENYINNVDDFKILEGSNDFKQGFDNVEQFLKSSIGSKVRFIIKIGNEFKPKIHFTGTELIENVIREQNFLTIDFQLVKKLDKKRLQLRLDDFVEKECGVLSHKYITCVIAGKDILINFDKITY